MVYGIDKASSKIQAEYPTTGGCRGAKNVDSDGPPVKMGGCTVQTQSKGDVASCVIPMNGAEETEEKPNIRKRKIQKFVDIKENSIDQTWTAYFAGTNIPLSFGYPLQPDRPGALNLIPPLLLVSDQPQIIPLNSKPFIIHASKTQLFNHFFSNFPSCTFKSNTGHVFMNVSKCALPLSFGIKGTFIKQGMRRLFNLEFLTANTQPTAEKVKDNFDVEYISGPLEILSDREERTYSDRFIIEFTNLESNSTITRLQIKYPKAEITPEDVIPLLEYLSQ